MIGTLTRIGTTSGLKAAGIDHETAETIGRIAGIVTTLLTLDGISVVVDGSLSIADGLSATADLHASVNS